MASFFNETTSFKTLQDTWNERKKTRTKIYGNMLYEILENDILGDRRNAIYESLLTMADHADRPSDLTTTLWTYKHAYVSNCPKSFDFLRAQNTIVTEGLAWSVGRTTRTEAPETLEDWEWTHSPMCVDEVVRNSGILDRLGALFGDHFLVKVIRVNLGDIRMGGPDDPVISRQSCRLQLYYFPRGVYKGYLRRRAEVVANAGPPTPPSYYYGRASNPFLWTGLAPRPAPLPPPPIVAPPPTVVIPPPPIVAPHTPPPAPPRPQPPRIRSRSEDDHDVHYYGEGIKGLRAAARATIAACVADMERRPRPPCHCCYEDDRYNEDEDMRE